MDTHKTNFQNCGVMKKREHSIEKRIKLESKLKFLRRLLYQKLLLLSKLFTCKNGKKFVQPSTTLSAIEPQEFRSLIVKCTILKNKFKLFFKLRYQLQHRWVFGCIYYILKPVSVFTIYRNLTRVIYYISKSDLCHLLYLEI